MPKSDSISTLNFKEMQTLKDSCQWDKLLSCCQDILKYDPKNYYIQCFLGDAFCGLKKWEEAKDLYTSLLKKTSEFPLVFHKLSIVLLNLGNIHASDLYSEKFLLAEPDALLKYSTNFEIQRQLGDFFFRQQQWREAKEAYARALKINEDSCWEHINLGRCMNHLGLQQKAIAQLYRAIQADPLSSWAHFYLIETLATQGKIDEAIDHLHQSESILQKQHNFRAILNDLETKKKSSFLETSRVSQELTNAQMFRQKDNTDPISLAQGSDEYRIISNEFDSEFYYHQYPDIAAGGIDPIAHYIVAGWKELRDPSPEFSTAHYLDKNSDIKEGGGNPFLHYISHGRGEGRTPLSFQNVLQRRNFYPKVSVIVPNYNHVNFLPERIESIINQTYSNFELLILDDCSSDNSRDVINAYKDRYPSKIKVLFNKVNSGNVFRQWRLGLDNAEGDLIWICESDDSCEADFLENLVYYFVDPSVMIAFGRIQFMDQDSNEYAGLDNYRETAEAGIWDESHIQTSHEWFMGAFGRRNIIANVGGCIFRRQQLSNTIWESAEKFSVCGDWLLYCHLAAGGQIAYSATAKSYFRQHSSNTSVTSFKKAKYYIEHFNVAMQLKQFHGIDESQILKFYLHLSDQYRYVHGQDSSLEELKQYFDIARLILEKKTVKHILIAFLGFYLGGGEILPIHLANQLVEMGYCVSMLALDHTNEVMALRECLDSRIAVYYKAYAEEVGIERFLNSIGADLIHSHNLGCEYLFSSLTHKKKIPYIVTHHGGYEASEICDSTLLSFLKLVDHWVFIADKNLDIFNKIPLSDKIFTKLPNAVQVQEKQFLYTRCDLGIDEKDFIFGIASRAIREKGWEDAIIALIDAQTKTEKNIHLLLCGDGDILPELQETYKDNQNIKFLGFQSNIWGFYRLCDCCVLPSRFLGESFPLTLIESIQAGTPMIATDLGEIRNIIGYDTKPGGILLSMDTNDSIYQKNLSKSMLRMMDQVLYNEFCDAIIDLQEKFSMKSVALKYSELYTKVLSIHE